MSILKRRRKKKLSHHGIAHIFSMMTDDDRDIIVKLLRSKRIKGVLPRTKKHIKELPSHRLVQKVLTQETLHNNENINYHKGGSLFTAMHAVWNVGANVVGGLFSHAQEHENNRPLSEFEMDMAQIVNAAYTDDRPPVVDDWKLLVKYSTNYTAVYQNSQGELCIGVRGTKLNMKDFLKDTQILAANTARDKEVDRIFGEVQRDFPDANKYCAAHSLGTTLVKNALNKLGETGHNFEPYLFNCGSSPLINTDEWREFVKEFTPRIFANKGDIVNAGILEVLPENYEHIVYSPDVSPLLWTNHSLNQWLPDQTDQGKEQTKPDQTEQAGEPNEQRPGNINLAERYTGRGPPDPIPTKPKPLHHFDDYDLYTDYAFADD